MREEILNPKGLTRWTIIFLSCITLYFLKGFFAPVLVALVIAFTTWPIYSLFISKEDKSSTFMATLAILAIIVLIIVPTSFISYHASAEIKSLAFKIISLNEKGLPAPNFLYKLTSSEKMIKKWNDAIAKPKGPEAFVEGWLDKDEIIGAILSFSSLIVDCFLSTVFMIIALFFMYRDGVSIYRQCNTLGEYIFPAYWHKLSAMIPKIIRSTFLGMTIIAIGEGIILGYAYWIAGAPSHVLLGILTAIMAIIPGGAPLSFTLVSVYLVLEGNVFNGICLLSWGTIELFIIDKTLRPFLVGGPIKLPFLPTFLGLVGGVRTMGLLGLFIGPVLMALITNIWKEVIIALRENNKKQKIRG
ncbi:AI-2E family transporter [Candidatus Liberibacter americanus]|uniref:Permease membrane protein n=1 Tax=Candidatus Liberibacter americanus str. Sao Paulo TaxID=1261131 RepID=U6B8K5_9HYPH|nr:AI-2E family transporter [Candidatus Liberibacter americanus]AHA28176.1 permease membrane protein [Candidatus Liberibacter americanus str. Sao Paulo]EMS35850.1 ABC transporter permease [Candidatus Liberibacter americanus PW_SP]